MYVRYVCQHHCHVANHRLPIDVVSKVFPVHCHLETKQLCYYHDGERLAG